MATIKFVRVERECDAGRRLHKVELNGWVFDAYYRDDGVMMLVGRGDPAEFDPPSPLHPDVIGLRADGRRLR